MDLYEVIDRVAALLRQRGRLTYRTLKLQFGLSDEQLAALTEELIEGQQVAVDEGGKVLVWIGTARVSGSTSQVAGSTSANEQPVSSPQPLDVKPTAGERRQLTVMFIDLVGSTTLSQQLDPEDYHARVVAYQAACRQVIARYEGHIAQYLGDGVLVYFGYPAAHEEDAVRAVRSGLEIVAAVGQVAYTPPLQVRIGIHTGPVMVGAIGAGERTEWLALGETPNIAARVQGQAEPDTVVMSAATYRLVQGLFECHKLDPQALKGLSTPLALYRVVGESAEQSRFEVAIRTGLTPLVGRESELGVLRQRWEQAKAGAGQMVLLSGEPGIGKSRLVQELKEHVSAAEATRIEFRCSPYHQNSALYPIIDHLQRLLQFTREDAPVAKLEKLQRMLSRYRFPQVDTFPLFAALLSLPHPAGCPPITVSPQKQREKTQAALVAWLVEEAERNTVYTTWEDVHWADPSTLDVLTLLLDQAPTTRLLAVLTFRPEFIPLWGNRSYLSQLTLSRLGRPHVETMVENVTRGKVLSPEVRQQIVAKTDGVPLFVEELTKTVLESVESIESVGSIGSQGGMSLQAIPIPATLQDSLMARLDRLAPVRELAQLGATLGREFSYELLHAVSPFDESSLQQGLRQLVEAELLYQRGVPPQATYLFKHALIQEAAYQALLRSTRQHYHQQIAQVLEEHFPETITTQPELLAHHYTRAGLTEQALIYWQSAGQKAIERSANAEAIAHLRQALTLLQSLPATPERAQQEIGLQIILSTPLIALKGYGDPEVELTYKRARELCQQVGETPQLFFVLAGLCLFYTLRAELQTAHDLAEQLVHLAESIQFSGFLQGAYQALGVTLFGMGDLARARECLERSFTYDDPQQRYSSPVIEPRVDYFSQLALVLCLLGYPDQALKSNHAGLILAEELSHPFSAALTENFAAILHQLRGERQRSQERGETLMVLSTEQGFALWVAMGMILQGWALAEQGHASIAQIRQGLAALRTTGTGMFRPYFLALLAEVYGGVGQVEEGLTVLAEAVDIVRSSKERWYEAELYRLKGELTLQQEARGWGLETSSPAPRPSRLKPQISWMVMQEAEGYFLKAIEIACEQQAKSLELRAVMSLSRLWQQQGKRNEAHQMLSELYSWFTEGFDTKDLQEAKALLAELA